MNYNYKKNLFLLFFVILLAGCSAKIPPPVVIQVPTKKVDYLAEVKPVLDARCVVCHSCYNSPCQLKLSSYEGLDRGATKIAIYNGARLRTMDPSRLFTDAVNTEEWRGKGFHSVTENSAEEGYNNSFMLQLVDHKIKNPKNTGSYNSEAGDLTCASSHEELGSYLDSHPNRGMPFGFPPLTESEFQTIAGWLAQGGHGPTDEEQAALLSIDPLDLTEVQKWETFLNMSSPKYGMTARYLYEHLFLAHIKFPTKSGAFYEMVRSKTSPGEPIDLVTTVRPYDDPGVDQVYYRFRKIHSTIVHKTHMVFELDDAKLLRFQELFIEPDWLQAPHLVGYENTLSANPFVAFEQIPPLTRYQFLLDNCHYIIMTFIRGPVCKGQVALNVINDQFWVMFLDPEYDLSVKYPGFLKLHADNLKMPHEGKSGYRLYKALSNSYYKLASNYRSERRDFYAANYYKGLDYEAIWKGEKKTDAPMLTVLRHFDSATVLRGFHGALPRTLWVIDFPVLERIYYSLVAGFDVYGVAGHQLATRLYMDALRIDGESNFLDFLPMNEREPMMREWYTGAKFSRIFYPKPLMDTNISFQSDEPKREFVETLIEKYIPKEFDLVFNDINYLSAGEEYPDFPTKYESIEDQLQAFHAASKPGVSFFSHVDSHNANLAYVRIRDPKGEDSVISVVINRWHDNVTYLFGEDGALDPSKDSALFIKGFVGSYPNYFLDVHVDDLPEFFEVIQNYDNSPEYIAKLDRFGVNRSDERFWEVYDWFQARFNDSDPVNAGLFDLNRYYHYAK